MTKSAELFVLFRLEGMFATRAAGEDTRGSPTARSRRVPEPGAVAVAVYEPAPVVDAVTLVTARGFVMSKTRTCDVVNPPTDAFFPPATVKASAFESAL